MNRTQLASERRTDLGVRAADRPGHSGRRLRLHRLRHEPTYDSLLAKLIVHADDMSGVPQDPTRAVGISDRGRAQQHEFLTSCLRTSTVSGDVDPHTLRRRTHRRSARADARTPIRYFSPEAEIERPVSTSIPTIRSPVLNVARKPQQAVQQAPIVQGPHGTTPVLAPMQGMVVSIPVSVGDTSRKASRSPCWKR